MFDSSRRTVVQFAALSVGALSIPAVLAQEKKEEVTPVEDLCREHGLLNRILLIYDHFDSKLAGPSAPDLSALTQSATIIKNFIESYHEKLEEDFLFPRFEKAGKLTDLVTVLRRQHEAGRAVTAQIISLTADAPKNTKAKTALRTHIQSFVRMYRPHEAREDTILFPALREIVSPKEYDVLGDQFEDKEHQLFGKEGFEGVLEQVAEIEKKLGIYDLSQFTPR
ncbi:MAG TPA: hemerythrin domain-containing protein [Terriglobales bacterium]|nr:hemerythrin domain-containing protein [Terriglobales bacterium]